MTIAELLKLKTGVKGLECEECQILKVYEAIPHKGKEYQGKMLPDWISQSIKVGDNSCEAYVNFKKAVNLKKDEKIKLIDIEINEYNGKKSLNAKGYGILNLTETSAIPQNQAEGYQNQTPAYSKGIDTTKREISPIPAQNQEMWNLKELHANRSMVLAYCKDLVCSGKIDMSDLQLEAGKMIKFIYLEEFVTADEIKEHMDDVQIPF